MVAPAHEPSVGTPGSLIRARREMLGWSVEEASRRAGVGSRRWRAVEDDTSTPACHDLAAAAAVLAYPAGLFAPTKNRADPTIDPRARRILASDAAATPAAASAVAPYDVEPANLGDLVVGKNSTVYNAHSYHTKVPPGAITPFIEHYTASGDWVLDPFCGSGMTGVASVRAGRNVVLNDLSSAAVHIARNYCTPCDPAAFAAAADRVVQRVRPTMEWLYQSDGGFDLVEYTVWSDVFRCPHCGVEVTYWDAAYQPESRMLRAVPVCPSCREPFAKDHACWVGEKPVEVNVSVGGRGISRFVRAPTPWDCAHVQLIDRAPVPYWYPRTPFTRDREMWRASHGAMGIHTVDRFFTRRNLHALAALREAILDEPDDRLARALMFAFTGAVNRASKRYQFNPKRPTNVMTGTLYVASLRYEFNVLSLFQRKVAAVRRYYEELGKPTGRAHVHQGSATDLSWIADESIDYVFTDPPFGANIYYADSSLLWEAWLGELTDQRFEAVVNRKRGADQGGKDVTGYGDLLADAFAEVHRVLKPGRYASIVFNNTDDRVWEAIRLALRDAGLAVRHTSGLDKAHRSIKGVKGDQGEEKVALFDVIVTVQKTTYVPSAVPRGAVDVGALLESVFAEHLAGLEEDLDGLSGQRRTEYLRDLAVRTLMARDLAVRDVGYPEIERILARIAERRDAGWYLTTFPL